MGVILWTNCMVVRNLDNFLYEAPSPRSENCDDIFCSSFCKKPHQAQWTYLEPSDQNPKLQCLFPSISQPRKLIFKQIIALPATWLKLCPFFLHVWRWATCTQSLAQPCSWSRKSSTKVLNSHFLDHHNYFVPTLIGLRSLNDIFSLYTLWDLTFLFKKKETNNLAITLS